MPHKAVAEDSKLGNLLEILVVVTHGVQREPTDGSKRGLSVGLSCLSIYLFISLSIELFCTVLLGKVCAAVARTFPTSKRSPTMDALTLLTSKSASRHNSVPCLISQLTSWLRTRSFSEPSF